MHANALVDTGAPGAAPRFRSLASICMETSPSVWLPLITSEAVLTELEMEAGWRFLRSGAIELATISDEELPAIQSLMSRYWDRPMDFADATLVYLAQRETVSTVFTVDRSDFETYRIHGRRRFRILPSAKPQ